MGARSHPLSAIFHSGDLTPPPQLRYVSKKLLIQFALAWAKAHGYGLMKKESFEDDFRSVLAATRPAGPAPIITMETMGFHDV